MAGGKITRLTVQKSSTEVGGDFEGFYKKLSMSAGDNNGFKAKVTNHGKPKEAELKKGFFVKGWWSSDEAGNDKITEAIIDDSVYFHIETRNIPNGKHIGTVLYDDDVKRATEEKDSNKGSDKIKLGPKNGNDYRFLNYREVQNNKVVISITLGGVMAKMIEEEEDKTIELFFACSYDGQNTELPIAFSDYLKVKAMPKIIFVNGQWKLAERLPFGLGENFGPTEPKKPYWSNKIAFEFLKYLKNEFNVEKEFLYDGKQLTSDDLENKNFILYYDGSSNWGLDQSGANRFANGREFAEENFNEITKGLGNSPLYFISHSEGGAYASGMADYLHSKGIKIGEHILLSPDEGDEFSINPEIPSYQLTYMFFSSIWNPTATIINKEKSKIGNKGFRKWGNYYAVVDWVTNEFRVNGTSKMGIAHVQDAGWEGVHGWTNSSMIFDKISDLKEVGSFSVQGDLDGKFYAGKDQTITSNGTKFYRIDDEYIITNCPPIIEIK